MMTSDTAPGGRPYFGHDKGAPRYGEPVWGGPMSGTLWRCECGPGLEFHCWGDPCQLECDRCDMLAPLRIDLDVAPKPEANDHACNTCGYHQCECVEAAFDVVAESERILDALVVGGSIVTGVPDAEHVDQDLYQIRLGELRRIAVGVTDPGPLHDFEDGLIGYREAKALLLHVRQKDAPPPSVAGTWVSWKMWDCRCVDADVTRLPTTARCCVCNTHRPPKTT